MDRIKFTEFVAHFFHSRLFLTTDVQKITGGQFNEKRNIQNNERALFSSEKKIIVIRLSLPYISSFAYHIVQIIVLIAKNSKIKFKIMRQISFATETTITTDTNQVKSKYFQFLS